METVPPTTSAFFDYLREHGATRALADGLVELVARRRRLALIPVRTGVRRPVRAAR